MDRSILSVEKQSNNNVGLFFESYAKSFDSIYGHNNKNRNSMNSDSAARVLEEIMIHIDYQKKFILLVNT